jgi:hypothetical protein
MPKEDESLDDTIPSAKDGGTLKDRFSDLSLLRRERLKDLRGADSGDIEDTALAAAAATRAAMASIADSDPPAKSFNTKKLAAILGAIATVAVALKELVDIISGAP